MPKVRDLMTRSLASVAAEDIVMEAARLMGERRISSVLVKGAREFSGILTDRDIISKVVSKGLDPSKIRVSEVMTSPLITINDEESIEDAARRCETRAYEDLWWRGTMRKLG